MRRVRAWLPILAGFGIVCSAACNKAEQNTSSPPLSAADRAKMAEMSRKAQISVMTDQINRSNLPPDQKQRLLQQVNASAGK